MTAADAQAALREHASAADAAGALRFFKCRPGEYGEGDQFLGVRATPLRATAKRFRTLPLAELRPLLRSVWHEERALALLILDLQAATADGAERERLAAFYLKNVAGINNWDLVDCSAPGVVGRWLHGRKDRKLLDRLAKSRSLWDRRIAIVATQHLIRQDEFADTLRIARLLLADAEDLIHKATGWMLREVGKKDEPTLRGFLDEHAATMPRTMLRYAVERLPEVQRRAYRAAKAKR